MGMPISSYTVLSALADQNGPFDHHTAQRTLNNFNLLAFIIHDPDAHADFHRTLAHKFDKLDYVTGEKLLFLALVDPPRDWRSHARGRDYYRCLMREYDGVTAQLLNPENAPRSRNPSITAFT